MKKVTLLEKIIANLEMVSFSLSNIFSGVSCVPAGFGADL